MQFPSGLQFSPDLRSRSFSRQYSKNDGFGEEYPPLIADAAGAAAVVFERLLSNRPLLYQSVPGFDLAVKASQRESRLDTDLSRVPSDPFRNSIHAQTYFEITKWSECTCENAKSLRNLARYSLVAKHGKELAIGGKQRRHWAFGANDYHCNSSPPGSSMQYAPAKRNGAIAVKGMGRTLAATECLLTKGF